ncbi:unnamed protein product, partial [Nesidiocoris tenuis]
DLPIPHVLKRFRVRASPSFSSSSPENRLLYEVLLNFSTFGLGNFSPNQHLVQGFFHYRLDTEIEDNSNVVRRYLLPRARDDFVSGGTEDEALEPNLTFLYDGDTVSHSKFWTFALRLLQRLDNTLRVSSTNAFSNLKFNLKNWASSSTLRSKLFMK